MKIAGRMLLTALLLTAVFVSMAGCGGTRDAREVMDRFLSRTGMHAAVFSFSVPEGERGHLDAEGFETLFRTPPDGISQAALVLSPSPGRIGECGVLVCDDPADALRMAGRCAERLSLLFSAGGLSEEARAGAFLLRKGDTVAYGCLPDLPDAGDVFRSIL